MTAKEALEHKVMSQIKDDYALSDDLVKCGKFFKFASPDIFIFMVIYAVIFIFYLIFQTTED